jgi:hypothetical protein
MPTLYKLSALHMFTKENLKTKTHNNYIPLLQIPVSTLLHLPPINALQYNQIMLVSHTRHSTAVVCKDLISLHTGVIQGCQRSN